MLSACLWLLVALPAAQAQIFGHGKEAASPAVDSTLFQTLKYRNIGPYRGGRSAAVAGSKHRPDTFFMGVTGGGVYRTKDGGKTWKNVSDGYFRTGSVGAVTVAPSDPNVVYVGMGETDIRGNMSPGDGMYKSTDGGDSWHYIGLGETQFIGDIVVHPTNPDIAWVAALGQTFGNEGNEERGIYKTTDGGKTWKKVLYKGKHAGAIDIAIDPNNPRILYGALWEAYRNPWMLSSGGPGSALYKSTDGGETWKNISARPGLPKGVLGKIGVAVSPANSNRVWAFIENKNGGLFRSDDAGKTWRLVNDDRKIRQRAWYYAGVYADPNDENVVFLPNVSFEKSIDGGKTFSRISVPHGDTHDLWINPDNSNRMVVSDDGGGQVTYNGGKSWSSYYKYATAQFYHVILDNRFPYRLYGAQQDNGTLVIKNRTAGFGIGEKDWMAVAGGESGYIAPDPDNPEITYGGSYGNYLGKFNTQTKQRDRVDVWPDNPMGHGAIDTKYRFQWTFPIYFSPHNAKVLYATSQYVHRSTDGGMSWDRISPDLTRDDKKKQGSSGGPITQDNTSIEYYNTVFSFAESPVKEGVLWAGADDGLVHVSRDNGKTWDDVTPKGMPEAQVNIIEPSPFDAGTAYMAVTRYKFNDFSPMLYKTKNYGKSWTEINNGIPEKDYTRVIREDPNRKGLLFAGTATGAYVSFNDGSNWQPLQLNLPAVAVSDMAIQKRAHDLALSTKGRAFWIFDDLGVLEQINNKVKRADHYLFKPEDTYLFGGPSFSIPGITVGQNPDNGVVVHYKLKNPGDEEVQLQFLENDNTVIKTYSNKVDQKGNKVRESDKFHTNKKRTRPGVLSSHKGLNKFVWNMRYKGATKLNRPQVLWGGSIRGATAIPGTYKVRLLINGKQVMEQPFVIKKDPRIKTTQEDFAAQFNLQQKVIAKLDTTQKALNKIFDVQKKLQGLIRDGKMSKEGKTMAKSIMSELTSIQDSLMQTKSKAGEDPLNYPIRLNNKLAALSSVVGTGDNPPTQQDRQVYQELAARVDVQLKKLQALLNGDFARFNGEVNTKSVPIGH